MTEQTREEQNTAPKDVAISVVMVVRDEELYVTEAIQSILDQTFRDFELIVVDDNSTDRTREIINSFDDGRIHLHKNPNTPGKSGGLNHGCFLARGKYIAHMDGDDISLPDRLQLQYDFMEKHPNIGVVGGGTKSLEMKVSKSQIHYLTMKYLVASYQFTYVVRTL